VPALYWQCCLLLAKVIAVDWIADPNAWISLATLTALEIVLGVDNIIFISILCGRLPVEQRARARTMGLGLAMGARIVLLFSLAWIMKLTEPLFHVLGRGLSGRDLILLGGGLFLLWKSVHEIHSSLEGTAHGADESKGQATLVSVLAQIAVIDIVFSLDSVITAVGLADDLGVMVTAVVIAVGVMMLGAKAISEFVEKHPTIKMLALSFLILVAVTLLADGAGFHIPKGYVYFAMVFSIGVEMLNIRASAKAKAKASERSSHAPAKVQLHKRFEGKAPAD
jgi:predicted tellurium resistance membrane protein TerC